MVTNMGEVESIRITTLIENCSGYGSNLVAQHGISFILDVKTSRLHKKILIDTGPETQSTLKNMELLGINPQEIDYIFLTHCHYDHTSALTGILKAIGRETPVIAHSTIFRENYIFQPCLINAGLTSENGKEKVLLNNGRLILIDEPFNIMDGVISTGQIERTTNFEDTGIITYNVENGKIVKDNILDDMSIVVNIKDKGIFIITGCSHSGIINIIRHSIKITGINKVYGVLGGFHLLNASEERIEKTITMLKDMDIPIVGGGHCTGFYAQAKMSLELGEKFRNLYTGQIIDL
jgi:7,8-dihydropterin-6-yl-methyl-4-(beta-D-ribofuranosyl)aminobenzene 5'-phosphate synthase